MPHEMPQDKTARDLALKHERIDSFCVHVGPLALHAHGKFSWERVFMDKMYSGVGKLCPKVASFFLFFFG